MALTQPHRQAATQLLVPGGLVPTWSNGYFILRERAGTSATASAVSVYNADGKFIRRVNPEFSGAARIVINDAVAEASGDVLAGGYAQQMDGTLAHFIARIDRTGKTVAAIRTNPFVPLFVCPGGDGTVWSFGIVKSPKNATAGSSAMLRQYSFKDGLITAVLDSSSFPDDGAFATSKGTPGGAWLEYSAGRVGIYTGGTDEWIEFNPATKQLQRWHAGALGQARITGLAFTGSGQVYASIDRWESGKGARGLFNLERREDGTALWMPLEGTLHVGSQPGAFNMLYGSDGDDLIHTRGGQPGTMFWSRVTETK